MIRLSDVFLFAGLTGAASGLLGILVGTIGWATRAKWGGTLLRWSAIVLVLGCAYMVAAVATAPSGIRPLFRYSTEHVGAKESSPQKPSTKTAPASTPRPTEGGPGNRPLPSGALERGD